MLKAVEVRKCVISNMGHLIEFFALCKTVTLSLAVWMSLLLCLPFFAIYRTIIDIILRLKHGKNYGGLFDTRDCPYLMPQVTKCSMTTISYIKSDREIDLVEEVRKVLQENVFDDPKAYPKLTGTKHDFGGYPYWLKNGVSLDDTVKPLELPRDKVLTEEYLKELTGELSMRKYPKNETVLWEVYVSEKSFSDNKNGGAGYRYPVILRLHHSICDGTSLFALFIRLFGDESSRNYGEELFKTLFKHKPGDKIRRFTYCKVIEMSLAQLIKTVRFWLELAFVAVGRAMEENQLRPPDQNALHKPSCSQEKIVAWTVEEHVESIPLIRKIRRKTNSKFISVVCTAISASMTNYFKKHHQSHPIPEYTSGGIVQLLSFPSIDPSKPIKLENKFIISTVELPTNKQPDTLIRTLKTIDRTMKQESNHSKSLVARFFLALVYGIMPVKLISSFAGFDSHTFMVSNIPGCSRINVLNGYVFEHVIGVAPNFKGVGFTLTLLSYDNKLQIGIMVDKSIIKSQKEVQRIADDILHYIKVMDREVGEICGE